MKQAELRFRRAHANIDRHRKHPGKYVMPPDRLKGMHQSTYERLVEDLETAYREWNDASHTKLVKLKQRMRESVDA